MRVNLQIVHAVLIRGRMNIKNDMTRCARMNMFQRGELEHVPTLDFDVCVIGTGQCSWELWVWPNRFIKILK